MNQPPFSLSLLAALVSASLLAACGGGQHNTSQDAAASGSDTNAAITKGAATAPASFYEQTPEGQPEQPHAGILAGDFRGVPFVDLLDDDENVIAVQVCTGANGSVGGLVLTTSKRTLPRHGSGANCQGFQLNAGEQILRVTGTAGTTIESLGFTTTQGRQFGPYGNIALGGQAFGMTIPGGVNGRFRGLKGLTTNASDTATLSQLGLLDGATGGGGGNPFIDRLADDDRVVSITTCWRDGAYVQSVQLRTTKGWLPKHGGDWPDQRCNTSALGADEFITEVFGRAGRFLDAAGYKTNTGRVIGPFGGAGGDSFSETLANPQRFTGLYGGSGAWMDRLGILSPMAGAAQGGPFRDGLPAGQTIHRVEVCTGDNPNAPGAKVVRSVQAFYNRAQPQALPRHGALKGPGIDCQSINLRNDEQVVELSGSAGGAIDSLRLRTSQGRTFGPYGTAGSTPSFVLRNPHPSFLGFAGRASQPGNPDRGILFAIDFATPDVHPAVAPAGAEAASQGWWGDVAAWPLIALHASMLPDGRMLTYGTDISGTQGAQLSYDVWDPAQGLGAASHLTLPNTLATDLFCSAQSLLPTGKLLLAGGDARDQGYNRGIRAVTQFDPAGNTLQAAAPMRYARWYASQTVLANGDVLVLGGSDEYANANTVPEVYSAATGSWRSLDGATSAAAFGAPYPRAFVTRSAQPQGRAVWVLATTNGEGRLYRLEIDQGNGQLTDTGVSVGRHTWDRPVAMVSANQLLVQLDDGNTRLVTLPTTGNAQDKPTVVDAGRLTQPRPWSEMVVLPTGDVLALNGSASANTYDQVAYHAELWSAQTRTWRRAASQMRPRLYHSTALLLTDGSVLSLGGGAPGPQNELNAQPYRPPYLYAGPRPVFSVANGDTGFTYGENVRLSTGNPADVGKVTLLRLGSTTHSYNSDQRLFELPLHTGRRNVSVLMPSAAHAAPPGFYLLTVVNKAGVPSASRVVRLQ